MMRLLTATIVIFLSSTIASADKKEDRAAFRKAYAEYQTAVEGGDAETLNTTAKAAYEAGLKYFGTDHVNTANLALNYAQAATSAKDKVIGSKALKAAEKHFKKLYGADSPEMIDIHLEEAKFNLDVLSDQKASRRSYDNALKLAQNHLEKDSLTEGVIQAEIGEVMLLNTDVKETANALSQLQKASKILNKHGQDAAFFAARTNFSIGKYYLSDLQYEKAAETLSNSLGFYANEAPSGSVTIAHHTLLVRAYEELKQHDKATPHLQAIGAVSPDIEGSNNQPIYFHLPEYPTPAERSRRRGYVLVEMTVDEQGFVKNPKIAESTGHLSFKQAALDAASVMRYAPRFENGKPVTTKGVQYRFDFTPPPPRR